MERRLRRHPQIVRPGIFEVDQANLRVAVHSDIPDHPATAQPLHELLVRRDQTVVADRQQHCSEFRQNLFDTGRVLGDLRVEADQRGFQVLEPEHLVQRPTEILVLGEHPAELLLQASRDPVLDRGLREGTHDASSRASYDSGIS